MPHLYKNLLHPYLMDAHYMNSTTCTIHQLCSLKFSFIFVKLKGAELKLLMFSSPILHFFSSEILKLQ